MENKHNIGDLYQMQSLPLHAKIRMTEARINGWVDEFGEDGVTFREAIEWLNEKGNLNIKL